MKHFGIEVAQETDITNLTMPSGTSFPANDNVGELFYRTDLDTMYTRNNSSWSANTPANTNLLINSDFGVWQRGTIFSISGTAEYTTDRFLAARNSSVGGMTVSRQAGDTSTYAIKMQRDLGNTATENVNLNYYIETTDVKALRGKNLVCKLRIKGGANLSDSTVDVNLSSSSATDSTVSKNSSGNISSGQPDYTSTTHNATITSSFEDYEFDFGVVAATANVINIRIKFSPTGTACADDSITIDRVQLEIGNIASDFEHRPFGQETMLCQRFYYAGSNLSMSLRDPNALREMVLTQYRPVNMRVIPTETFTYNSPVVGDSTNPTQLRIQVKAESVDDTERSIISYTADAEI